MNIFASFVLTSDGDGGWIDNILDHGIITAIVISTGIVIVSLIIIILTVCVCCRLFYRLISYDKFNNTDSDNSNIKSGAGLSYPCLSNSYNFNGQIMNIPRPINQMNQIELSSQNKERFMNSQPLNHIQYSYRNRQGNSESHTNASSSVATTSTNRNVPMDRIRVINPNGIYNVKKEFPNFL
ncbi:hypothetical protein A3Q56_04809 [Intoshia linei]|uniref:Uncharacterized protein n=1 Tax=Intoshia linei TaxID=1819745 RepID=A0A177AZQ5_9BILA|nr:hypothetical protein A3Q56_04809 [Intoshia linei]